MADGAKQHDEKIRARKRVEGWEWAVVVAAGGWAAGVHIETVEQMMQPQ